MINIKNARKSFGEQVIFNQMNLSINKAGIYFIVGESGSGKSTLLNLLAGLDHFDSGEIDIDSNLSTIFQNYELINELTVQENIFLTNKKLSNEEQNIINILGLNDLLNHYCNELSGGQKQRVGIARALVLNPNIILCDEPTESLDIDNKHLVMKLFKELSKNKIILIVSHDRELVEEYADCIYEIKNQNLSIIKELKTTNEVLKSNEKTFNKKDITQFFHKLLIKKTVLFSSILVVLILLFQSLFLFQKSLFYQSSSLNTVNADMAYIKINDKNVDLSELELNEKNLIPIVNFIQLQIDGKEINSNIYPYIENELDIKGNIPKENEIIINQNVASILGNWEDREVEFNYILNDQRLSKIFKISGVVYETDTTSFNFYYDLDLLMEEFELLKFNNGKTYKDYLYENATYYQINVGYSNLYNLHKRIDNPTIIRLSNPLYEERESFKEDSAIYICLFIIVECILYLAILFMMVLYIYKDIKNYFKTISILASLNIPVNFIKKTYVLMKVGIFTFLLSISSTVFLGIYILNHSFKYISKHELKFLLIITFSFIFIYLITILLYMIYFKKDKIGDILKNSKDA